jgi:ribosomal protein S18 acetylase RimI-like enzyme
MYNNNFKIELLQEDQCEKAAMLRFEEADTSLFIFFGLKFFTEVLKATTRSRWGFGLVCLEKGKLIGFTLAVTDLKRYYLDILFRRGAFLLFELSSRLITSKGLLRRILSCFLYPSKVPNYNIKAQWLTLVVKKEYRNNGIGRKLTFSLIEEFKRRNINKFKSTIPLANSISCSMHRKYGFKLIETFLFGGDQFELYIYEMDTAGLFLACSKP